MAMKHGEFATFRLVGGTALGLQPGHRISEDIDFFTDTPYGSADYAAIEKCFRSNYPYVDTLNGGQDQGLLIM